MVLKNNMDVFILEEVMKKNKIEKEFSANY